MRISNLDLSETEVEKLQSLAKEKGHDVAVLSPANLVRAALGFDLRNRGGARERPSPSGVAETGQRVTIDQWLNLMHQGDCIELMDKMPAESVDLVVTSPPYNLRNSTGNGMKDGRGGKWEKARLINGYQTHDDNMPHDEYAEWQRRCLRAMMRVLKNDGAIFYNHKWRVQGGLLQDRHDIVSEFPVRQIIIWQRSGGINFNPGYFLPTYEVIYMICKPDFKLALKANAQGDVWNIPQESNNSHPAPFPVELAQRCVRSTNAQIILDPFAGSGSTAIAAEACGREWIGMDVSPEYCQMANKRIQEARKMLTG